MRPYRQRLVFWIGIKYRFPRGKHIDHIGRCFSEDRELSPLDETNLVWFEQFRMLKLF
jgi:hypothetical protein